MIKAIIFDVDGVLIDSFQANLRFHRDLMEYAGYPPPTAEEYAPLFTKHLMENIKILTKLDNEDEIKKIWHIGKNRVVPYPDKLVELNKNVSKTIKILSRKYILAIASGRLNDKTFQIPRLNKFKKYFKTAVWYTDTQKHKPHPDPLLLACKRLKVKPNEAVYVGDGISDMQAARAAGMKCIAYPKPLDGADACISSFDELPDAILKL